MTDPLTEALARALGIRPRGPAPDEQAPEPPALNSTTLEDAIARAVGADTKENR